MRGAIVSNAGFPNRARRAEQFFSTTRSRRKKFTTFQSQFQVLHFFGLIPITQINTFFESQVPASQLPLTRPNTSTPPHSIASITHAPSAAKTNHIPLRTDAPFHSKSLRLYMPKVPSRLAERRAYSHSESAGKIGERTALLS